MRKVTFWYWALGPLGSLAAQSTLVPVGRHTEYKKSALASFVLQLLAHLALSLHLLMVQNIPRIIQGWRRNTNLDQFHCSLSFLSLSSIVFH